MELQVKRLQKFIYNAICLSGQLHYLTYVNIGANSMDTDQTAPSGAVLSGSTLFV